MNHSKFTPAALEAYQEENGGASAATVDFNTDEVQRKRQVYANLLHAYHQLQLIDEEGCLRVTLESLNHKVTVQGSMVEVFSAFVEPLISKLAGLERVIVAMTADLPRLNEAQCTGPTPEFTAITALCLPATAMPTDTPERCPLLPESTRALASV